MKSKLFILLLSVLFAFAIVACEKEGPAEKAGEKIDESIEKVEEKVDESVDKVKDKAEEVADDVEEKVDEVN